jgi:hypothetical protein
MSGFFWQLGIVLLFLFYIRRDVLLKYRNVIDISEYVNEMMGSSSHQPPKGKFDDVSSEVVYRRSDEMQKDKMTNNDLYNTTQINV